MCLCTDATSERDLLDNISAPLLKDEAKVLAAGKRGVIDVEWWYGGAV